MDGKIPSMRLATAAFTLAAILLALAAHANFVGYRQFQLAMWANSVGKTMAALTPPLRGEALAEPSPTAEPMAENELARLRRYRLNRIAVPGSLGLLAASVGVVLLRRT